MRELLECLLGIEPAGAIIAPPPREFQTCLQVRKSASLQVCKSAGLRSATLESAFVAHRPLPWGTETWSHLNGGSWSYCFGIQNSHHPSTIWRACWKSKLSSALRICNVNCVELWSWFCWIKVCFEKVLPAWLTYGILIVLHTFSIYWPEIQTNK